MREGSPRGKGGTLLAGVALALCCALPIVVVSGLLAGVGGWLARAWPLVVVGVLLVGYAVARWAKRTERESQEVPRRGGRG